MSGKLQIQKLPYGQKFDTKNSEHREIINNNNVLMRVAFDRALKKSKNPAIQKLTLEERQGFAVFLTAQAMHESTHQTKETGTYNFAGRKGKGTVLPSGERLGGKSAVYTDEFINFDSLNHFAEDQVEYMNRMFPKFYQAKTYEEAIRALQNEEGKIYATDLFEVGNEVNTFEDNMNANQYYLKIGNYIGHAKEGEAGKFLQPPARPDMIVEGEYPNEVIVISNAGKNGVMRSLRGIYQGTNYIDNEYYNQFHWRNLKNIINQKENSNNNLNEKYAKDYTSADIMQTGLTREQLRNSLASSAGGNLMFQEIFPDNYDFGAEFFLKKNDSAFDFKTRTTVDSTGELTGPIDFEASLEKDGAKIYGGQRNEESYFGGSINKEIKPGVKIKGGFEKEGDLKQGHIGLEVDLE